MARVNGGKSKKQKTKKGGLEMGIAAGIKDITQDIVSSYDARVDEVKRLKKEANEMLDSFEASHQDRSAEVKAMRTGFQSSRKEMSAALKKDLAEHTQGVRGEVARLRQEIGASHQDRSAEVKAMRSGFQSSHKEMSAKLRKNLAQGETERKQASAELKKDLTHGVSARKSEVKAMRQETKADLKKVRTTWQGLAHTMEAKRAGVKVPPKVEVHDLEAKLLAAVNKHPKGVSLAEVAQSLDVVPVVLGRTSSSLLKKGLISKKEKLYFPVAGE